MRNPGIGKTLVCAAFLGLVVPLVLGQDKVKGDIKSRKEFTAEFPGTKAVKTLRRNPADETVVEVTFQNDKLPGQPLKAKRVGNPEETVTTIGGEEVKVVTELFQLRLPDSDVDMVGVQTGSGADTTGSFALVNIIVSEVVLREQSAETFTWRNLRQAITGYQIRRDRMGANPVCFEPEAHQKKERLPRIEKLDPITPGVGPALVSTNGKVIVYVDTARRRFAPGGVPGTGEAIAVNDMVTFKLAYSTFLFGDFKTVKNKELVRVDWGATMKGTVKAAAKDSPGTTKATAVKITGNPPLGDLNKAADNGKLIEKETAPKSGVFVPQFTVVKCPE